MSLLPHSTETKEGDIVEPHTLASGPLLVQWCGSTWAAMYLDLDKPLALAAHQHLCCSAAVQPDAHQLLLSKAHPFSSGTACGSATSLSRCCEQDVCRGKSPCEGPALSCCTLAQPECRAGALSCRVRAVQKQGCTSSPVQGPANRGQGHWGQGGSHPIRALI